MNSRKQREIFLATCLLESIEDENYRNTKKLLTEHHANPNLLVPDSNIAPIHYAAGMENTHFAEAAMKLILKCNGDPNVQTVDGETPLHIAVIWNRVLIVKMLLDHGADITIKDSDNNTPINHAISEKHFNLLPIFQNFAFEKKIQRNKNAETPTKSQINTSNEKTPKNKVNDLCKRLKQLDLPKTPESVNTLTPNQTNFNLKSASPFLVDIKCRRPTNKHIDAITKELKMQNDLKQNKKNEKPMAEDDIIEISSDSEENTSEIMVKKNLFELTEENLEKHLRMTPKKNRISLVSGWRDKVNKSRKRKSILPVDGLELDLFIMKNTVDSSTFSIEKNVGRERNEKAERKRNQFSPNSETNDSFVTAHDLNGAMEKDLDLDLESNRDVNALNQHKYKHESEIIFQTQEKYQHVDVENDVVFYEHKLLAQPVKLAPSMLNSSNGCGVGVLDTTSETATCTDCVLPTDYDTDDLRKELKYYGDNPGPINKSTKRLYLKRLVRYKRKKDNTNQPQGKTKSFSIELQKTLRDDVQTLDFIHDYSPLERLMIESFQLSKKFREGNLKTSFIYLLIDPCVLENLLAEISFIPLKEAWRRFINAIFYVGKGKSSRPFAHLYDAIKLYNHDKKSTNMPTNYQESLKLERIIDIWRNDKGVICLPVFHNIMPAEAYTREAAIIDCLGVENLTNIKRGDYYGVTKTWTARERKKLGILLLFKALHVFMVEGESQLRPDDIKKR